MKRRLTLAFNVLLVIVVGTVHSTVIKSQDRIDSEKNAQDLETILNGVNLVHIDGTPGFLSVYGPDAFPILVGQAGGAFHPIVAGNRAGAGKLLGFSHDGLLIMEEDETGQGPAAMSDRNKLILNSVEWVSGDDVTSPKVAILKQNVDDGDSLVQLLSDNDISVTLVSLPDLSDSSQLVGDYDVVITKEFFEESRAPILQEYLEGGGGVIIGVTSWASYAFLNVSGHFGANFPPNRVSRLGGFVWRNGDGEGYAGPTSSDDNYNASQSYLKNTHVLDAWMEIRNFLITGNFAGDLADHPVQFSSVLEAGLEFVPPQDSFLTEEFYEDAKNFTQAEGQPVPSEENPVTRAGDKFLLQLYYTFSSFVLKPEDVQAHPGSQFFPGQVNMTEQQSHGVGIEIKFKKPTWFVNNNNDDGKELGKTRKNNKNPNAFRLNSINKCHQNEIKHTKMVNRQNREKPTDVEDFEFNTKLPLWYSTGLYAPAGSPIKIVVNSSEILKDFQIQIGTHTDDISRHDEWPRSARITVKKTLENNEAVLASPMGGLIFVIIPEEAVTSEEQVLTATVTGSVRTPHFKLGQTLVKEWRDKIRYEPGAWAEFETENIVLSAPRSSALLIDDPEDLLIFWNEVMDAIADLAAIPRQRYRQERMTPDVLISAGFMHSGYPIMTFLAEGDLAINVTKLRTEGSWGHFHELGHNHQRSEWTFSGTGEVTNNLFALYVYNTVCGIPSEETRAEMSPAVYKKTVSDFIVNGRKFSEWQSQPFLALLFYHQLQKEYGWTSFKQVFASYHDLEQYPNTDEEKIDLWLVMFSKVVGENLASFFDSWGIPVSGNATIEIGLLPDARIEIYDLLHDS